MWFSAVAGYDLATGWGSANGQSLIDDLAGPQATGLLADQLAEQGEVNPGRHRHDHDQNYRCRRFYRCCQPGGYLDFAKRRDGLICDKPSDNFRCPDVSLRTAPSRSRISLSQ